MASPDNLARLKLWTFRTFTDSWVFDAFLHDTETLIKALQKSLSNDSDTLKVPADTNSAASIFNLIKPETVPTPTGSGSEPEMATKH
uniref:Uncharacterized protein n=1 Tax=Nelumbo nucifera TaxID=4432 RepID=A0A822XND9_NELNU|nr:TPA_asm: hypothetical protein HUJ06_021929 [Nelumbo nucifera]